MYKSVRVLFCVCVEKQVWGSSSEWRICPNVCFFFCVHSFFFVGGIFKKKKSCIPRPVWDGGFHTPAPVECGETIAPDLTSCSGPVFFFFFGFLFVCVLCIDKPILFYFSSFS